ncbi:MAG: PEP-CTERM sorting domain-containing protein, partial [Verrucomicrobiales bacterium]|nr:PEP-CTERM sorting domain-containing protein [Verrucomicrobiales bacterium]
TPLTNSATGTFSLQKGLMTLNGNNVVNDGVTNYDGAVAVTFDGTGRFINNGTFNHQVSSGNDNLTLNGTVVFENNGTFDFQEKGEIDLTGAGAVFLNNGVLMKTVAGSDPSYVFRNGSFTAAAGSEVISQAGLLHFGVDGTSDAAATWTADGGTLQIAGEWTGTIAGESVSDGAGGFSYVQIGNSGNGSVNSVLAIGTAGLTFDIAGGGLRWEGTTIDTQGNTMTSVGGFLVDSTATRTLSGGGELVIGSGGTFDHVRGTVTLADNSILRNQGTTTYVNGTTATSAYSGAGEFINDALGTVNYQGGTLQVNAGVTYRNQGQFNLENAGSFSGDGVILNDTMGTMTWVAGNFGIADGTEVINNGLFEASASGNRLVTGTGTFTNNGVYNQSITDNNGDNVGWSGAGNFVNHGEFNFTDNSDYQMEGGTTFTNAADGILTVATTENTDPAQFFSFVSTAGSGTFDNQGTVEVTSGVFRVTGSLAGAAQFEDVVLVQNNGTGGLTGGTWIADSTDTGTARIDLNTFGTTSGITSVEDGAVVDLTGAAAQVVQLSSLATLNGELYVNGAQNFSGSGSVMVGSTGILGGDGAIADSLTINGLVTPGTTQGADLGILTMGSDATFGSTSTINLGLGAVLGTVNGGLDPVAMGNAILALGDLDPTGNQHDALDINGTLTLDPSMTINVFNEGVTFAAGQFFDLLDFANVAGINGVDDAQAAALLNLPDPGALAWDTSLFRSNGIVYLTDPLVIPEPGRAVLLGMAALGLLLRRRRK